MIKYKWNEILQFLVGAVGEMVASTLSKIDSPFNDREADGRSTHQEQVNE
jgi:hypothetical protein